MKFVGSLPDLIETRLFGENKSRATRAGVYIALNLILILGLFYVLLNNIVYDWTGTMYKEGFHLNTALDNAIPFAPTWAIFYIYLFYPLSAVTMVYFGFVRFREGYALGWALVVINLVSDLVYLVFPVTTDIYRTALLSHQITGNPLATAMYHH